MNEFSLYEANFPESTADWWSARKIRVPLRVRNQYGELVNQLKKKDLAETNNKARSQQVQSSKQEYIFPKTQKYTNEFGVNQVNVKFKAVIGAPKAKFIDAKSTHTSEIVKAIDTLIKAIEYGQVRTITPGFGNFKPLAVGLGAVEDRCPNLLTALRNLREKFVHDPFRGPIPAAYDI